jgi:hypothetical protein
MCDDPDVLRVTRGRHAVRSAGVVAFAVALMAGASGAAYLPVPSAALRSNVGLQCRVPKLKGLTVRQAHRRAARSHCRLRVLGAAVKLAAIQTIARQDPSAGRTAGSVTVWVNPLCFRSALSGPPPGEPIVRTGPTRLLSGLFVIGGPLVQFSTPRCAFAPERSWAGTITVVNPATNAIVATRRVTAGRLASFDPTSGEYTIEGLFAKAFVNGARMHAIPQRVNVPAGKTVRQDVIVPVP